METINCIKTRRSKRLFLKREVPEKIINEIIECAITAPSSMDCQPWHFVVVKDGEKQERLAKLKSEDNQQHVLTAPVTIVVCVDTEKSSSRYIEDGVTATQNILLAAHDLGIGSVYITGCNPLKPEVTREVQEVLSLPEKIMPITILPIGYPDPSEEIEKKSLLKPEDVIHYDKW